SSASRCRSSGPARSARACLRARSSDRPRAAAQAERGTGRTELAVDRVAHLGEALVVELLDPLSGRPCSAAKRLPELVEIRVLRLDLKQLGVHSVEATRE